MSVKAKYIIPELSVFFPCHNEEKNIENTINKAVLVLNQITPKWQIVLVNDGSTDKTLEKAKILAKKHGNKLKIINHLKNKGYGGAFKTGLYNSKYDWITFTDSDGQFDFSDIKKLIKKQKETNCQVILGYRAKRRDSYTRILIANLLKIWNFVWFGFYGIKDVDCAFKLFNKKVIDQVGKLKTDSAITTTELLIKIKKLGFKWAQVPIGHYPRLHGSSSGSDFKVMKKAAIDSINLWKALH